MLQGQDPFDEFRSRRKVEQLESDIRTEAERKRARMRQLLGQEEEEEEKVRRRVEAEMEDFFHAGDQLDEEGVDEIEDDVDLPIDDSPTAEIQHQLDAALGGDERSGPARPEGPEAAGPASENDELEAALDRLRRADTDPGVPRPRPAADPEPAPAPAPPRPTARPEPLPTVASGSDTLDWLDLTEERIGDPVPPVPERETDDFDFGGRAYEGPITRARPGVIDPFATPQKVAAKPEPVRASNVPLPGVTEPSTDGLPATRSALAGVPTDTRLTELERRMAKLEAALDRLTAMVEARSE